MTRILVSLLAIMGAVYLFTVGMGVPLGNENFWNNHGFLFLIFIAIFPRLTLLLSGVPWGGLFWWLGLAFAPRILVALLATLNYWKQNPLLVAIAWFVAIGGESSEKYMVVRRARPQRRQNADGGEGFDKAKWIN